MVVRCPSCFSKRVSKNANPHRFAWKCDVCKREFNVTEKHFGESVMKSNAALNRDKTHLLYYNTGFLSDSPSLNKQQLELQKILLELDNDEIDLLIILLPVEYNQNRYILVDHLLKNYSYETINEEVDFLKSHKEIFSRLINMSPNVKYWLSSICSRDLSFNDNIKSLLKNNSSEDIVEKIRLSFKQHDFQKKLSDMKFNKFKIFKTHFNIPDGLDKNEKIDYIIKNYDTEYIKEKIKLTDQQFAIVKKLDNINEPILNLLLEELNISNKDNKEENNLYLITNFSIDDLNKRIKIKEKQNHLFKRINSLDNISFNRFNDEFHLQDIRKKEEKIIFTILNYDSIQIKEKLTSIKELKRQYYDYIDKIDDDKLDILCIINGKSDFKYRNSKVTFIIEKISKSEFDKQYDFINWLYDLDENIIQELFKSFDITSPKKTKTEKISLICSYYKPEEIRNSYENIISKNKVSLNAPSKDSSPDNGYDISINEYFEAEKIYNEKIEYAHSFEKRVKDLIKDVKAFKSEFLDENEKENLIYGIETILDDFHRRLKKLDNLKPELLYFKSLVDSNSINNSDIYSLNKFIENLKKVKIDIYERRLNSRKNVFDELIHREEELENEFNNKVLDYKELYSNSEDFIKNIILKSESIEDEIDLLFKKIDNLDTNFVPEEEINLLKNNLSNISTESKEFISDVEEYLTNFYEFEHLIDNYTNTGQIDAAKELLKRFIDNIEKTKLTDFSHRLEESLSLYNDLYSLEKDLNNLDDDVIEKISELNDILEDDFFNFEIMAYNFSNEDLKNIKNEIINDIKKGNIESELSSDLVIDYFEKYNQNNYNFTEEDLDNIIKTIDLSIYDEDIIKDSKDVIIEYSKNHKIDEGEILLLFKNNLIVKTREKDNLIILNSIFDESNGEYDNLSFTEDQWDVVYNLSKERILNGYKGSVNKLVKDEINEYNYKLKTKARESLEIFYKRNDFYQITHIQREQSGIFINRLEDFIELNEIRSELINVDNMVILSDCFIKKQTIEFIDLSLIK